MKNMLKPAFLIALLTIAGSAFADSGHPLDEAAGTDGPKLEIRQYRFSRHGAGYDRLVLEFDRKDHSSAEPKVWADNQGSAATVHVENVTLLGAIPESLINDSFSRKSRFLGPISVNMDAANGFSVRTAMKGGASSVKVLWLNNPARLVIDAHGSQDVAHRETLSISRHSRRPTLADLMCFPATSKVGLTVAFLPQSNQSEELQNVRVNTDGVTPQEGAPPADAIVCYPKKTQIIAALSFEERPRDSVLSNQTENLMAPEQALSAKAAAEAAALGDESDLDPGPLTVPASLGQLPMGARAPATAPTASAAPAGSPLSLLPPLNK